MRKATLPDQKAHKARDEVNSDPSSQVELVPLKQWLPTVQLERPKEEGKQKTFPSL